MTKFLQAFYALAFAVGAAAVVWIGAGYGGSHPLALAMTLLIGAFYLAGAAELQRFRRDTRGLDTALGALNSPPAGAAALADWLASVPAPLRPAVRLRAEGQRAALPGPALTPYVVGLLVLLGMLGTFLGMVVTLNGTVLALEGSVELQAMRAALAAPVRGLGLAFGTSVAGVCASAALGLMSALARRERLAAGQRLDGAAAGVLRAFSPEHHREQGLRLMQAQADVLPALVDRLDGLMAQLARQHETAATRLAEEQARFQRDSAGAARELALTLERALQAGVADSTRRATEGLHSLVAEAMAAVAAQSAALHERAADSAQARLDGLAQQVAARVDAAAERWTAALAQHDARAQAQQAALRDTLQGFAEGFEARTGALLQAVGEGQRTAQAALAAGFSGQLAALVQAVDERQAQHAQQAGQTDAARLAAWQAQLAALAADQQQAWRNAAEQAHQHAQATVAEVARLMQTAAEAPRAAAEVVGQLRAQLSASVAHDNALLEERQRLLGAMAALVERVREQAEAQRAAVDALVERAAGAFERGAARLEDAAAQVAGGAAEVASLGEAFGGGVERFGEANERLLAQLQRVEAALDKSGERSDTQLAYYVAQARELIDLSLLSQKRAVEEIRQLGRRHDAAEDEVA